MPPTTKEVANPDNPKAAPPEKLDQADAKGKNQATENEATLYDLFEVLDDLGSPGDTCAGGEAKDLPVAPGLHVKGVGTIPLPLTPETAEKLRKVCRQAPHGRGTETVVDTSVRNTLEIDADKVNLENPSWNSALNQLAREASTSLGVNANLVTPKLYKMLLYEEGGFFKKHRDTEKENGMFATLVVQLPSKFKGGSFVTHHNGREKKFSFDYPNKAPYQCYFVTHYADCEHEVLPIETGHRLVLVYSLCYTGNEATKPTAKLIQEGGFVSTLNKLRKSDSLFAVPLDHKYTTSSLSRYGIGSLKGSDRALSKSISQVDGWEMVITKLERTDEESGNNIPHWGWDTNHVEAGSTFLEEMFGEDGECADDHHEWLSEQLTLKSIDDDGMILATEDECKEMWEQIESTLPEYTGNAGCTRETTYHTYVLIAFSNDNEFERTCRHNFSDAIEQIEEDQMEDSDLLDRAINYLKSEKPKLSHGDFLRLQKLLHDEEAPCYSHSELLSIMFRCLDSSKVPHDDFLSMIGSLVKDLGRCEKTEAMFEYLDQLPVLAKGADYKEFLKLANSMVKLADMVKNDSQVDSLVSRTVAHFEENTPPEIANSNNRMFGRSRRSTAAELKESLTLFAAQSYRHQNGMIFGACFARMRTTMKDSIDHMADELELLGLVASTLEQSVANEIRSYILSDYVSVLEGKLKPKPLRSNYAFGSSTSSRSPNVWEQPKVEKIVREINLHGAPNLFQRITEWASGAALPLLSAANIALTKNDPGCQSANSSVAKERCMKFIRDRICQLEVSEDKELEQTFLRATRNGRPTFTWSMPNARTRSPALNSFLHSMEEGPKEIVVGGSIEKARQLSNRIQYGNSNYKMGAHGQLPKETFAERRVTDEFCLSNHYSATISNTKKAGSRASVVAQKTKQLFQAQVKKYDEDILKLRDVQARLRKHGQVHLHQQPPAKRLRTDVEVIVIE